MTKFLALAVAGFVAVSVSQASAATSSYTGNFGSSPTDFSQPFTVQGFDSSLGTLTAVSLVLNSTGSVAGNVKNNNPAASTFTVSTNSAITVTGSPGSFGTLTVNLAASQAYTGVASGATVPYGPFSTAGSSATVAGTPSAFLNPGLITLTASSLSGYGVAGGGNNVAVVVSSTAAGTVGVTYTYTPTPAVTVPEPASMALLGMGLAGLGLIRRRRA